MAFEMCYAVIDDLKGITTCQVCFQRMQNPKALSCLHSFCQMCIADMLPIKSSLLSCPICRKDTVIPEMNLGILPTAFFINQISDILMKYERIMNQKGSNTIDEEVNEISENNVTEWQGGFKATSESPTCEVNKIATCPRYNVRIERTSLCSKKEHIFVAKEFEKEYKEGDEIKLKLWKFCGNNATTPCCAWLDSVDCTMVDTKGRVWKFTNTRISHGGWELSCKADRVGLFILIIKVSNKPVKTIQLAVKSTQLDTTIAQIEKL